MDKKLFAICVLTLTAILLLIGNFVDVPAQASQVASNRDYTVLTARVQNSGEGLYVVDNRSGLMAVFTYDNNAGGLRVRAVRAVADAVPVR